ncbi:hypothetical protein BH10ACI1_BH10ACI1_33900 [soil metagenome]
MNKDKEEMLDEYDFTGKKGVRGKYHEAFKKGYTVRVIKENGTTDEQYFASIESDIHRYFPDSESVNNALRSLITAEKN